MHVSQLIILEEALMVRSVEARFSAATDLIL